MSRPLWCCKVIKTNLKPACYDVARLSAVVKEQSGVHVVGVDDERKQVLEIYRRWGRERMAEGRGGSESDKDGDPSLLFLTRLLSWYMIKNRRRNCYVVWPDGSGRCFDTRLGEGYKHSNFYLLRVGGAFGGYKWRRRA